MKYFKILSVFMLIAISGFSFTWAHCEIPCGIYNDHLRIDLINEHISTIEKSMKEIIHISSETPVNQNQLIRWITNKEAHAVKIQNIVSQYFLHQRIKIQDNKKSEEYKKYLKQLELLHKILVFSMKSKQSCTLEHCETLKVLVKEFEGSYFHKH